MTSIDAITVAARSLRTVIINYTDEKGSPSTREVEPYSLRPGKMGSTRFFGYDYSRQQIRGFRLDRIDYAEATENTFVPKWVVEL